MSAPAGGTPTAVLAFCVLMASANGHSEQPESIQASLRARWRAVDLSNEADTASGSSGFNCTRAHGFAPPRLGARTTE
jgi:hypothetical protein